MTVTLIEQIVTIEHSSAAYYPVLRDMLLHHVEVSIRICDTMAAFLLLCESLPIIFRKVEKMMLVQIH